MIKFIMNITYYTLTTFEKILKKNKLKIMRFFFNKINGGSIEIHCAKQHNKIKVKQEKINTIKLQEAEINYMTYKV